MAESELGVLSTQCLDRRIPDKQTLTSEIAAWETDRNKHHAKADWQFTTADARVNPTFPTGSDFDDFRGVEQAKGESKQGSSISKRL
jgi:hypothetical protein